MSIHQVFVVGLSGGLGQSLGHELTKHSFTVYGSYKSNPTAQATYFIDLADSKSIEAVAQKLKEDSKTLDSLIINSGISVLGPQLSISNTDYELAFRVNFFGPREIIKSFLPFLKPDAKIILIGSVSSWGSMPMTGAYGLSKKLLRDFWNILRQELLLDSSTARMKLILVEPGAFRTPIWNHGIKSMETNFGKKVWLGKLFNQMIEQSSDPKLFSKKLIKILQARNPKSYHCFGSMSLLSRLSEFWPVSIRMGLIRTARYLGIELKLK